MLEIEKLFLTEPPFDHTAYSNHTEFAKSITRNKGGRYGFIVYVLDNNDKPILPYPFSSYGAAQIAIGLKQNSRLISRYIDTNKVYNQKYIFYSYDPLLK
jgi:hypothetical protein